jgi:putative RecB family exonuclease
MPSAPDKRPLSYSKFWTYTDCPLQYKLTYLDKIPEKPRPEYSMGRSIHKAIELFHRRGPSKTTMEDMNRILDKAWDPTGFPDAATERRFKRAAKEIMSNFYQDASRSYRPPLAVELKFDMEIDGIPFTGRLDAVEELEDGTLEVIDYKSGEDDFGEERVRNNPQLGIYQLAAEAKYNKKVSKITLYHLRSRKRITTPAFNDEMKANLKRALVTAASCIEAGMFDPRLSQSCPCDYPEYCPYFKDKEEYRGEGQSKLMEDYDSSGLSHEQIEELVRKYAINLEDGKANSAATQELETKLLAYCQEHDVLRIYSRDLTVTLVHALDPTGESYITFALHKEEKEQKEKEIKARQDDYV